MSAARQSKERNEYLVSENSVAGYFAMWATRQSPFGVPDDLHVRVRMLRDRLGPFFKVGSPDFRCAYVESVDELTNILRSVMEAEVMHWNRPRSGHDQPFVFCSRYDKPRPEDDFIDLDALFRNVAASAIEEARREG